MAAATQPNPITRSYVCVAVCITVGSRERRTAPDSLADAVKDAPAPRGDTRAPGCSPPIAVANRA